MLVALGALLLAGRVSADELRGRVVAVADGDTITVLTSAHLRERVRLAAIDAPESRQPFGAAAKRHLSALVFGAQVRVEYAKRDRYGRIVGRVLRDGQDAGLAQIESGLAWHTLRYAREQPSAERSAYAQAERAARSAALGLWAEPTPVAPWDWRAQRRQPDAPRAQPARLSSTR